MSQGMHLSNTETIPGKLITASYGLVQGSTVRAKNAFKDFGAGLKNLVGGELKAYTELLQESRNEALQRMMLEAQARGAQRVGMPAAPGRGSAASGCGASPHFSPRGPNSLRRRVREVRNASR